MKSLIKGIFWVLFLYALAGYLASKIANAETKKECHVADGYAMVQTLFAETSNGNVYGGWLVMPSEKGPTGLRLCLATIGSLEALCYRGTGIDGVVYGQPLGEKFEQVMVNIPAEEDFCEVES